MKNSPLNENCIIYCRVSSKEQIEGTSLDSQEIRCRTHAEENGWNILKIFREMGESAKSADRTELNKAIEFCSEKKNGGVQYFIVYKIDRFSRFQEDHYAIKTVLKKYGTQLRSVSEPIDESPVGKLMEAVVSGIAEFDNSIRAERTKAGMIRRFQEGVWVWPVPLGFCKPLHGKGTNIVPDPTTAHLIKLCFEEYAKQTWTYRSLAKFLSDRGLKTKKGGKPLTPQLVYKILHNPIYCGRMDMFGESRMGTFEPIINESLFEACQGPQKLIKPRDANNPSFPLRKFIVCSECGGNLTGSHSVSKGRKYGYYHHGASNCSKTRSIPKTILEEQFVELLNSIAPSPEYEKLFKAIVIDVWEKRHAEANATNAKAQKEMEALSADLQKVFDLHRKGVYTDDDFVKQKAIIDNRIRQKRLLVNDSWDKEIQINEALNHCFSFLRQASRTWKEASYPNKLRFQKLILEKPVSFDGEKFGNPDLTLVFQQKKTPLLESSSMVAPRGVEPLLTA